MDMKKIFLSAATIAIIFTSCDYISQPIPPVNAQADDTSTCTTPTFPTISSHVKKILLEDYTGHTCTNCPNAARKLEMIDTAHEGQIIPLALHVSNYALPGPAGTGGPAGSYQNDYRTSIGDAYDVFFKISNGGLPKGMVGRTPYNGSTYTHRKNWWEWDAAVTAQLAQAPKLELQIINNYDAGTTKLCSHVRAQFLTADTGTFKLVMLLVQDSIIDWQFDGGTNDSDYVHRHVLRDAINSTWGSVIATGNITSNHTITTKFAYKIPADFKSIPTVIDHMHVVGFVYDAANYEVLQAEEAKVVP